MTECPSNSAPEPSLAEHPLPTAPHQLCLGSEEGASCSLSPQERSQSREAQPEPAMAPAERGRDARGQAQSTAPAREIWLAQPDKPLVRQQLFPGPCRDCSYSRSNESVT